MGYENLNDKERALYAELIKRYPIGTKFKDFVIESHSILDETQQLPCFDFDRCYSGTVNVYYMYPDPDDDDDYSYQILYDEDSITDDCDGWRDYSEAILPEPSTSFFNQLNLI